MARQIITLLLVLWSAFGQSSAQTLRQEMNEVNRYWSVFQPSNAALDAHASFKSDIDRIQTHLYGVVKHLRNLNTDHLTPAQIQNRHSLLNILQRYADTAIFPKNIGHTERTPYFIDHRGVPCAVGHLIIQSGFGEVAQQIHRENNFGYIMNLVEIYPEIKSWADKHGFSIEELAWIQPGYPFEFTACDTFCYEDYFFPIQNGTRERLDNHLIVWMDKDTGFIKYGPENPRVCSGDSIYVLVVQGRDTIPVSEITLVSDIAIFSYIGGNKIELPIPDPLKYKWEVNPDRGNKSGSLSLDVIDGIEPVQPFIYELGNYNIRYQLKNLKHGIYGASIRDGRECIYRDTLFVDSQYIDASALWISQTLPGRIELNLDTDHWLNPTFIIIHPMGIKEELDYHPKERPAISVDGLPPGIYVLIVKDGEQSLKRRFLVY